MGVDRTIDWFFEAGNILFDGFEDADKLWLNMQQQIISYIESHGGHAGFYDNK
jgi:hypothetical protein